MTKRIPVELVNAPNTEPMTMDRGNLAHRPGGAVGQSACGLPGRPITLAQAIVWSAGWCSHSACYESPYSRRRGK